MEDKLGCLSKLSETRLAVVFSGGVSLAVYESGVALEFYRLVKGEGVYGRLKDKIGPVIIDVITGTSAGGMNGVFLANALVNRGDMRRLIPLWLEEGDFDKLLYGPLRNNPQSLLDGGRFLLKIHEALSAKRADSSDKPALQSFLDLFVTGTSLDGDRVVTRNVGNREEESRTYRQVFHFRYFEDTKQGGDKTVNDFEGAENIRRLAIAARVTASFPGAFEPVLVRKSEFAGNARFLEADGYHMDGGVLDNKPLDLALKAIDARSADRKVERILFFVDPDPENILSRSIQNEPEAGSPFGVLLKAVVSIPMYQSLTSAFQDIEQYNQEIDDLQRTMSYYEVLAGEYREMRNEGKAESAEEARYNNRQRYMYPSDRASALYRALEDGYLDLRLKNDLSPELLNCFADGKEGIEAILARELAEDRRGNLPENTQFKPRTPGEAIYSIKKRILVLLDLKYPLRLCSYLTAQIRELYPEPPSGTGISGDLYILVTKALNAIKQTISEFRGRLEHAIENQAETREMEIGKIINHLTLIRERLKSEDAGNRREEAMKRFAELNDELNRRESVLENGLLFDELFKTVYLRLNNEFAALEKPLAELSGCHETLAVEVKNGYWKLLDALECFFQRDLLLYPQTLNRRHSRELQKIRYERISPDRAESFIPGLSARDKLAGDMLGHFSGFLSEKWRGNDLVWGRLDAAEIIIKRLLPGADHTDLRDELVRSAQEEIIEEMTRMGLRISNSANPRDGGNLIGREGPKDLPQGKKLEWSLRGTVTFMKIVRQSLAKSSVAFLLKKVLTVINLLIGSLIAAIIMLNTAMRKPVLKILLYALLALALMIAGFLIGERWLPEYCVFLNKHPGS